LHYLALRFAGPGVFSVDIDDVERRCPSFVELFGRLIAQRVKP